MKLIPRSAWTSILPKSNTMGDVFNGLNYFDANLVNIEFSPVGHNKAYASKNPVLELELLLKEGTHGTGLSDINFNYAISQNTEGIYVLRGQNKCHNSDSLKVLMLIGPSETPSDLLKENQKLFSSLPVGNNIWPRVPLSVGNKNVHVFDLIECLAERGYYETRNDGTYGKFCELAVTKLQNELGIALTGEYDLQTYHKVNRNG